LINPAASDGEDILTEVVAPPPRPLIAAVSVFFISKNLPKLISSFHSWLRAWLARMAC
jgi:hypothetical protein